MSLPASIIYHSVIEGLIVMKENKRIEIFDGMRGLAAVVVLIYHVLNWSPVGLQPENLSL